MNWDTFKNLVEKEIERNGIGSPEIDYIYISTAGIRNNEINIEVIDNELRISAAE